MKTNQKLVYPGVVGCRIEEFNRLVKEFYLVMKEKKKVRNYLLNSIPQIDYSIEKYFVMQFSAVFSDFSTNCACRVFDSTEFFNVVRLVINDGTLDDYSPSHLDKELLKVFQRAREHLKSMNRKYPPVDIHRMVFFCPRSAN